MRRFYLTCFSDPSAYERTRQLQLLEHWINTRHLAQFLLIQELIDQPEQLLVTGATDRYESLIATVCSDIVVCQVLSRVEYDDVRLYQRVRYLHAYLFYANNQKQWLVINNENQHEVDGTIAILDQYCWSVY
jgi:hypothetical protein